MSEVFFIKSILASNMICVLQNTNQSHCSDWGKYFSDIFNASFAFILELFIHFFFRSESSLKIPWAHFIFSLSLFSLLKGIFYEKIGIDWLRSIKPNKQYKWLTNTFFYLISCLKICWVLCTHSTFPRFSSSSIAQVFIKFKEIDLWKSFKFFGFIFIFWGLVFECKAILAYSC